MSELKQRRSSNETFGRLRELGDTYSAALESARNVSFEIEHQIEAAMAAGHSMTRVAEASGLSVSQLEYILVSVGVQNRLAEDRLRLALRTAG